MSKGTFFYMSPKKQWLVGGVAGLLIAGAIIFVWESFRYQAPQPSEVVQKKQEPALHSVRESFSFAPYQYEATAVAPNAPDTKATIAELKNLQNFEHPLEPQKDLTSKTVPLQLTDTQKNSLQEKNFFVTSVHDLVFEADPDAQSGRIDDWTDVYGTIGGYYGDFYRAPENTPFVTTDYMLHVYHRLVEKEFEHAEQTVLYDHVKSLSRALFQKAVAAAASSTSEEQQSFERLSGYFLVPLVLTESVESEATNQSFEDTHVDTLDSARATLEKYTQVNPKIRGQVEAELGLIYGASDMVSSPLLGEYLLQANPSYFEDYTQFGPRSHYAKNSILRSYFRSMMWFGRQNLLAASPELTRDALAITTWMQDPVLKQEWEAIYKPTTFFVGESDDLGIYEYEDLLKQLGDHTSWSMDDIKQAQDLVKTYKAPQILSSVLIGDEVVRSTKQDLLESTRGFRFMGQRFTPDAFIINQLTKGQEQGPKLPSMTTALLVMAAFGDQTSEPLVEDWISQNAPDSREALHAKLAELKQQFATLPEEIWGQNIYWGWTRTLKTLFQKSEELVGYPSFMKNNSWRIKDTQAALGSWTELKHDTLLYAKQSYAEMGGGGDEPEKKPPVAKGYVEPNMEFWDRFSALSKMTYQGMSDLGLVDQTLQGRNEQFLASLEFFRGLAKQEIENQIITDEDFERLRLEPGKLRDVIDVLPGEVRTEDAARAALVADIHTDVPGKAILYEADGKPNSLFVAVKDANGTRLTRGLVYDYYEFTGPLTKRLTDKDWRAAVYTGKALGAEGSEPISFPARPTWTDQLK